MMTVVDGRQIGRKDKLFGEMGTIRMPLTSLPRMGPPAERE